MNIYNANCWLHRYLASLNHRENKKISNLVICLETNQTEIYLCSDVYLYAKKCFVELNCDENRRRKQKTTYCVPVGRRTVVEVFCRQELKNKSRKLYTTDMVLNRIDIRRTVFLSMDLIDMN